MPPKTTPKPSKEPPAKSRANYLQKWRLKKQAQAETEKTVIDTAITIWREAKPILERLATAFEHYVVALSSHSPAGGASAEAVMTGLPPLASPMVGLELTTEAVEAPAGPASLVLGKYPDDPTGHKREPLFTLDTELTDACMRYFRENHADQLELVREYDAFADTEVSFQMMRACFIRLGLPIPADDPDEAKKVYLGRPF